MWIKWRFWAIFGFFLLFLQSLLLCLLFFNWIEWGGQIEWFKLLRNEAKKENRQNHQSRCCQGYEKRGEGSWKRDSWSRLPCYWADTQVEEDVYPQKETQEHGLTLYHGSFLIFIQFYFIFRYKYQYKNVCLLNISILSGYEKDLW